jgi:hypothetical protein
MLKRFKMKEDRKILLHEFILAILVIFMIFYFFDWKLFLILILFGWMNNLRVRQSLSFDLKKIVQKIKENNL